MDKSAAARRAAPKYERVDPRASSLIESLRAFGYSPQAAIADLVDNSVTAHAQNVWITFTWAGSDSHVTVLDDGDGMDEGALREAMRPGTLSPLVKRDLADLGRFGLGLKTASFSQCRCLSVSSKRSAVVSTRSWDLDYVGETGEWRLLTRVGPHTAHKLSQLDAVAAGTVVLWERTDRLVANADLEDPAAHRRFLSVVDDVELHLRMVFHRFLSPPSRRLRIWINDRDLTPWDPYLLANPATDRRPPELLLLKKQTIKVSPYILPHNSLQTDVERRTGGGSGGWNAQQGFYVYRNDRLLVAGNWLGLGFVKEEHYKLARIAVDLPNTMDHEWDINVTKSKATPPGVLRADLTRIAKDARARAVAIYRFRGKITARQRTSDWVFVWVRAVKMDGDRMQKFRYTINRNHPVIADVLGGADSPTRKRLESMLKVIEETVPIPSMAVDSTEYPDAQPVPFERVPSSQVSDVLRVVLTSFLAKGISRAEAVKRLHSMEPFDRYPELIEALSED